MMMIALLSLPLPISAESAVWGHTYSVLRPKTKFCTFRDAGKFPHIAIACPTMRSPGRDKTPAVTFYHDDVLVSVSTIVTLISDGDNERNKHARTHSAVRTAHVLLHDIPFKPMLLLTKRVRMRRSTTWAGRRKPSDRRMLLIFFINKPVWLYCGSMLMVVHHHRAVQMHISGKRDSCTRHVMNSKQRKPPACGGSLKA
jgi:hypothetical protein